MTAPVVQPFVGRSVCLFCASSDGVSPRYAEAARAFGRQAALSGWRLVYGGGGVGLMGHAARAAHAAGGRVLGVMPAFLRDRERLFDDVETVIVPSMHVRKTLMYDQSDAFVVAPGGVGTLEEAVEVLSWKRLALHDKPVVFLDVDGFWSALLRTFDDGIRAGLTPASFAQAYVTCDTVEAVFQALDGVAQGRT